MSRVCAFFPFLFVLSNFFTQLLAKVVGNVGFIFTNGDLGKVRDVIEEHRVPAPARVGSLAPIDVKVPPGPTGCDPGQTSFFQVLQVRRRPASSCCVLIVFCFCFLSSVRRFKYQ